MCYCCVISQLFLIVFFFLSYSSTSISVICILRRGTLLHFVSLDPGVYMGTSHILLGGKPTMDYPLRGSSNTPGRTSCQGNWDKLQPFMPLLLLPLSVLAEYLVWFMHSFFAFFRCWYCVFDMGPCQLAWMSCCIHCLLHCYPLWEHDYFAHSKIWYEHIIIN